MTTDRLARLSMTEIAIHVTSMGPLAQLPTERIVPRATTTALPVLRQMAITAPLGTTMALPVRPTTATAVRGMTIILPPRGVTNLHLRGRRLLSRLLALPTEAAADQAIAVAVDKGRDNLEYR